MDARIIFLGTGGDAHVVGSQRRASGGIILQVNTNQFVIDPGPGSLVMAKQADISMRNTTAVLVSHNHLIHANDANAAISAMTFGGMDPHGVILAPSSVFRSDEENQPFVHQQYIDAVERAISIEPDQRIGINEVEIRVKKTYHSDPFGVGFKFFTTQFTLGYTSDTGYRKELAEDYKETDIMIINVKNPEGVKEDGYLNTDDAITMISEIKPKLAIITHFGEKMLAGDPLNGARKIQKITKVQTLAATDGLSISPTSYSAGLKTKTLNLY